MQKMTRPLSKVEKSVLEQTKSQRYGLNFLQRKYLKYFFGYSPGDTGRKQTRTPSQACYFIQKTLFNENESADQIFRFRGPDKDIDLLSCKLFPTVTNTDEMAMEKFLSEAGVALTDNEQIAIVRAMTSFNSAYPTDLYLNRGDKCLTG